MNFLKLDITFTSNANMKPCESVMQPYIEVQKGFTKMEDKLKFCYLNEEVTFFRFFVLCLQFGGSLAEYATAPIKSTVKRPRNVSAIDGACFGVAGMTALQSIRDSAGIALDGSSKGKNVLITAASGGVGTYAVQVNFSAMSNN